MQLKVQNLKKICRTCLSDKNLKSISNTYIQEGLHIADVLIDFIIKDLYHEKLSQNICTQCIEQVNSYYQFKHKCNQNEILFKTILDEKIVSTEIISSSDGIRNKDSEGFGCTDSDSHNGSDDEKPLLERICISSKEKLEPKKDLCERSKIDSKHSNRSQLSSINDVKSLEVPSDLLQNVHNYPCKLCDKSFTFKYKLVMHMRVHTKEKPFQCEECHLCFSLNGNLKRHKMIHTGEKPHVCQICNKGFIQATSLSMHYEKHKKDKFKSFTCTICSRVFVRISSYNFHFKKYHPSEFKEESTTENNEKLLNNDSKFQCNTCGKKFGKLIFLKRHSLRHGEKKFLCSECGKGFVRKADLQSHLKVHTGEKPHVCHICNKSFAHSGSLVTHSLVHSGYKPYNCSLCSKSFTQLSHLKIHERTHSGERPYSCSFCKKTFALKSNLTVHIRTHTGETPYLCNICGKGFYDSSSMKKHKICHVDSTDISKTENIVEKSKETEEILKTVN